MGGGYFFRVKYSDLFSIKVTILKIIPPSILKFQQNFQYNLVVYTLFNFFHPPPLPMDIQKNPGNENWF